MGCPEWEAASFNGRVDSTFPDWWATELGGWQRPDWFVQGPVGECLYLRAKNAGDCKAAAYFWTLLQAKYWELLDGVASAERRFRSPMPKHLASAISVARNYLDFNPRKPSGYLEPLVSPDPLPNRNRFAGLWRAREPRRFRRSRSHPRRPSRLISIYRSFLTKNVFGHLKREAETGTVAEFDLVTAIWRCQRRTRSLPRFGFEFPIDFFNIADLDTGTPAPCKNMAAELGSTSITTVQNPKIIDRPEFRYFENYGKGEDRRASQRVALLASVMRQFQDYPAEALVFVDAFASTIANEFADVLEQYDIVQGYSTDGFIPFINGFKNYACYEHGTLREIPFEKSYNGIACSSSYKNAAFSFVTNSDVLPAVQRLKLERGRTVYLPHAFNDQVITDFLMETRVPKWDPQLAILFSPTRHHWHTDPVSMQKGNDLLLKAAAQVARTNPNFRIILVDWGVDAQRSRDLIRELRIEDMVSWRRPLNKAELRRLYWTSNAVVDQFKIPAIGGVTFEAMALGRRVITNIDEAQTAEFFGAAPPCLAADSIELCAARICEILADPLDGNGRGDAARQWFEKYHSAQRVVELQLAAYRAILRSNSVSVVGRQEGNPEQQKPFKATVPSFSESQMVGIVKTRARS